MVERAVWMFYDMFNVSKRVIAHPVTGHGSTVYFTKYFTKYHTTQFTNKMVKFKDSQDSWHWMCSVYGKKLHRTVQIMSKRSSVNVSLQADFFPSEGLPDQLSTWPKQASTLIPRPPLIPTMKLLAQASNSYMPRKHWAAHFEQH